MQNSDSVSLLTHGEALVLNILHKFAWPVTEVLLPKDGHRLIIEPISSRFL